MEQDIIGMVQQAKFQNFVKIPTFSPIQTKLGA